MRPCSPAQRPPGLQPPPHAGSWTAGVGQSPVSRSGCGECTGADTGWEGCVPNTGVRQASPRGLRIGLLKTLIQPWKEAPLSQAHP